MPVCQYCGKELRDYQGLSGHIQLKHLEYFRKQGGSGGTGSLNQAGTGTATTISSQVTPRRDLNAVLSFLRARGRRRMKNCPYAKRMSGMGSSCAGTGASMMKTMTEDSNSFQSREKIANVPLPSQNSGGEVADACELKEKVERIESGLRKLGFFQGG
jgi:hypothetical protein